MKRTGHRGFADAKPWLLLAVLVVPQRRPAIEIKDFDFVESKEQKRTMQIRALKADLFKPEDIFLLDAPRVLAWGKARKPFEISGQTGVMNSNSQDLEIRTATKVLTPDGFEFKTRNLSYEATTQSLAGEDPVEMRSSGAARRGSKLRLTGVGVRISLEKNLYEILRNVIAEQTVSPRNTLTVRSQRAEISPENNQAAFHREVTVKSTKLDLRGESLLVYFADSQPQKLVLGSKLPGAASAPESRIQAALDGLNIRSQGLEVAFNEAGDVRESQAFGNVLADTSDGTRLKAQKLQSDLSEGKQRLRLEGNVTIETGTRVATCEQALFFPETGDIYLERVASVKSGEQVLEGEKIRFSTRNSEVRVEGARGQVGRKQLGLR